VGVEPQSRGHAGLAKHRRRYRVRRLAVLERESSRGMPQGSYASSLAHR